VPSADYVLCDVFTDRPLAGNQLAVLPDARAIPDVDLQRLAKEFNFSETTFVFPAEGDGDARMRIFTPDTELPFAGHPTLGTAAVLGAQRHQDTIALETTAGLIPVELERTDDSHIHGWMRQPMPKVEAFPDTEQLFQAIGVEGSLLPVELYDNGVPHVYVALPDEGAVATLRVDTRGLPAEVGVNCFAAADDAGTRWKTRCFFGGDPGGEDPGTGSAAGPLLYHLVRHGQVERGAEIEISQGVEIGRPSTLYARTDPAGGVDEAPEGIYVGGGAVILGGGTLTW